MYVRVYFINDTNTFDGCKVESLAVLSYVGVAQECSEHTEQNALTRGKRIKIAKDELVAFGNTNFVCRFAAKPSKSNFFVCKNLSQD